MSDELFNRFASTKSYPDQFIQRLWDHMFMWSLNDIYVFEMFFHANGEFSHYVQENSEGDLQTFTKLDGKIPDSLSQQLIMEINRSPNQTLTLKNKRPNHVSETSISARKYFSNDRGDSLPKPLNHSEST